MTVLETLTGLHKEIEDCESTLIYLNRIQDRHLIPAYEFERLEEKKAKAEREFNAISDILSRVSRSCPQTRSCADRWLPT